jgi:NitT/TauT family transport system substrate-binding protein
VAGDAAFNASVLKTFNYIPSYQGAYDAFKTTAEELKQIGVLRPDTDLASLQTGSFVKLPGVKDNL